MNWHKGLRRLQRLGIFMALLGGSCLLLLICLSTLLNYAQYEYVSRWAGSLLIGLPVFLLGMLLLVLCWIVDGFLPGNHGRAGRTSP